MIRELLYIIAGKFISLCTGIAYIFSPKSKPLPMKKNIQYVDDGSAAHQLDIIYPPGRGKGLPFIVNIHGGGFGINSKGRQYKSYGLRLAAGSRFAVVNINFRLSVEAKFPAQIEDALLVLTFLHEHAGEYGLDMDNMFLCGDSSGAYMAAMTGCVLTNAELREYYGFAPDISCRALAVNCGIFDFESFMGEDIRFPMKKGIAEILFGSQTYTELPVFKYSSVLKFITPDFPPTYIMDTGDTGKGSFEAEAKRLEKTLMQNNVEHSLHIFDAALGLPHSFNIRGGRKESQIAMDEMFDFFSRNMRG